MSTSPFQTVFPSHLRHWAIHCALNSSPNFCIALVFLNLWKSPFAVAAILCAISTFILLFLPVYITTMVEGFILSFILFMISFFAVIFVQARDRRRLFTVADPLRRVDR